MWTGLVRSGQEPRIPRIPRIGAVEERLHATSLQERQLRLCAFAPLREALPGLSQQILSSGSVDDGPQTTSPVRTFASLRLCVRPCPDLTTRDPSCIGRFWYNALQETVGVMICLKWCIKVCFDKAYGCGWCWLVCWRHGWRGNHPLPKPLSHSGL
jgi:hypothetical protein